MGRKLRKRPRTDPDTCRRKAHSGQGPSPRLRSGRRDPAGRAGPEAQNPHPPTKPPASPAAARGPATPETPPPSAPTPAADSPSLEPATPASRRADRTSPAHSNPRPFRTPSRNTGPPSPCAHSNPRSPRSTPQHRRATGLRPLPVPIRTRPTTTPAGLRWNGQGSWKFSVSRFKRAQPQPPDVVCYTLIVADEVTRRGKSWKFSVSRFKSGPASTSAS